MHRLIYFFLPSLLVVFFLAGGLGWLSQVQAATTTDLQKPDIPCELQTGCDDLRPILDQIARWLVYVASALFFFMFLWGALQYLTGAGNRDQTTKAKGAMVAAGVGLLITIASYAIVSFVIDRLTG